MLLGAFAISVQIILLYLCMHLLNQRINKRPSISLTGALSVCSFDKYVIDDAILNGGDQDSNWGEKGLQSLAQDIKGF